MKTLAIRLFLILGIFLFNISTQAFEVPIGKSIDKNAVTKGIEKHTKNIQENPQSQESYVNRAFLYYLIDDIEKAISDYNTLISIDPKNEEYYLNRGYLKHISHKREEALKDYDLALQIRPDYAFAHNNRGVALAELGRDAESLIAYNTAIKLNPEYADAYYNRGNLKTKTENNEEALKDFDTAIKLNPTDSASFNNRGVVKRKLNYNIGALSDFSIAIKLNPEDITAFANRGRLKKRYFESEGAEEDFKNAIAISEDSPILIKEIELEAQIANSQKQSQKTNSQALHEPKVSNSPIQKIAYNKSSEVENIKPATVKASLVQVAPKTATPAVLETKNNVENLITKKKQDSTPQINTKPVENPKLAECYFVRALQKYILQNRESALADLNMAIKYNPNYAEAYYYRAAIKRDFKDEGFVDDYTRAVTLNPELKSVNDADVLMILKI